MANSNSPFGFRLLGLSGGSASATFGTTTRAVASNAGAIYRGDPVEALDTGYVRQWQTANVDVNVLVGIFDGCKYFSTALQRVVWSNYWPGSGATGDVEAYIIPCIGSPAPSFVVQVASTALTFADIGTNHGVTIGTGNTTTGISGAALTSAVVNTALLPFTVTGLWSSVGAPNSIGTDDTADYNWVVVRANVGQNTGI